MYHAVRRLGWEEDALAAHRSLQEQAWPTTLLLVVHYGLLDPIPAGLS